jgi:hypothetical protein
MRDQSDATAGATVTDITPHQRAIVMLVTFAPSTGTFDDSGTGFGQHNL